MTHLHYSLELPQTWQKQTESYKKLVYQINELLDKKEIESKSTVVIELFELAFGTMEYLEFDALALAKTEKVLNNPRIKSYENQLLSIMLILEDICQTYPELALDRYVLFLEIFNKLIYVDLDAVTLFINFISKINSKINIKRIPESYLKDYTIFCTEIAIISFESHNFTSSLEIFNELTSLFYEPSQNVPPNYQLIPFLGLAICYEVIGNYAEASNAYFELYNRIRLKIDQNNDDDIPLQCIHETMFYGYICSFLSDKVDRLNYFYSLSQFSDQNINDLLNGIHSMAVFGFPMFEAFNHINLESIVKMIKYYLESSCVQSNQVNNSLRLSHSDPKLFLPNVEFIVKNKGVQKAILIVQTQHLKDIQVTIGKSNLPALNVLPDFEKDNYVVVDGVKFTITSQFAFGTSFSNDIEVVVHYQKKQILKRKLTLNDRFPPFYLIDIDKELDEIISSKEGSVRQFDVQWSKDMSLVDTIKAISMIDLSNLTFSNENESKNFFKELINLFKKLNLKESEKVIVDLSKQEAINMIMGKALKLVIIQRLSELEPNNPQIFSIIEYVANQ